MPHAARWRCPGCGREFGTVAGPTLALVTDDGLRVLAPPRGAVG